MSLEKNAREAVRVAALRWLDSPEGKEYLQAIKDESYRAGEADGFANGFYVGWTDAYRDLGDTDDADIAFAALTRKD